MIQKHEYRQIGGDLAVGTLLAQVHYWSLPAANGKTQLRVKRDGQLWIAKTRKEWCCETGLSLEQYKRAITVLKAKGLVETRIMKFNGQPMTHLRLRAEAFDASLAFVRDAIQVEANTLSKWCQSHHPSGVSPTTPYTELQTKLQTETTFCESPGAVYDHATGNSPGTGKGEQGKMNLSEILKKTEAKKYGDSSTTNLVSHWQRRKAAITGSFQAAMTGKTLGQLKQFRLKIGDAADPAKVIDYAFDNWWEFSKKAEAQCDLKGIPTQPQIGFMLQHVTLLVNMFLQSIAPKPVFTQPAPKTPAPAPQVGPAKPEDAPYKLSWEEMQKGIAAIQAGTFSA